MSSRFALVSQEIRDAIAGIVFPTNDDNTDPEPEG
jgi:hypothetical protein